MAKQRPDSDSPAVDDTAQLTDSTLQKKSPSSSNKSSVVCYVRLLDGTEIEKEVSRNAKGQELVDKVCEHLVLSEKDYFSCSYFSDENIEKRTRFWLNHEKTIKSQMGRRPHWTFSFEVKFYPVEPETLHEEQTRYLLFLQLRSDILTGKLPCSFVTLQLLGSYAVQSDLGDYDVDEHGSGINYIKDIQLAPQQSEELLEKIQHLHMTHRGQSPSEAEMNYLDNAKKLAFYGVDLHHAQVRGKQGVDGLEGGLVGEVQIGVSAHGISVYKDRLRIFRWSWPKIIEFTYDRQGFLVKIRPKKARDDPRDRKGETVFKYRLKYELGKRLWQSAVEHHAFFRLAKPVDPERAKFPKVGSKFRYGGRTQQQVVGGPETGYFPNAPTFSRAPGTRFVATNMARSGTLDTSTGYSTDRAEKYHYDDQRTNTLDLKNRKKPRTPGSTSELDGSQAAVPIAGFEDDRNLTAVDPGYDDEDSRIALLSGERANYSKGSYRPPGGYNQHDVSYGTSHAGDSSFNDSSMMGPGRTTLDGSRIAQQQQQQRTITTVKQTTVNVVMAAPRQHSVPDASGEESLPPYQEDQQQFADIMRPKGQSANWAGSPTSPGWGPNMSRESKTSSRQYTDSQGNFITEFTLERDDGIVEKRIEKRTMIAEDEDELDHDKALREAIQAVTDMNPDLSVEKIEIQTTAEQKKA